MKRNTRARLFGVVYLIALASLTGCETQQLGNLQQRRVDIPVASGADESIDDRFGLTADAQDPSERDAELGYGRWKAKPEAEGTSAPTSPNRRGAGWSGSPE